MLSDWKCNICLKSMANDLVPCSKCKVAMFCSDECHRNILHQCGLSRADDSVSNGVRMSSVCSILLAISMFSNVDEFMHFVENALSSDSKDQPDSMVDDRSRYRAFSKLYCGPNTPLNFILSHGKDETFPYLFTKVGKMFRSVRHTRFLHHLIGHHLLLINYNSITSRPCVLKNSVARTYLKVGIFSYNIKPTCIPNVYMDESEGYLTINTIRPVKKGIRPEYLKANIFMSKLLLSKEAQQKHLLNEKRLNCK